MSFPSCNLVNLCIGGKVHAVDLISSNCLYFSQIFSSSFCKYGSSCNKVHSSMVCSNNWVQLLSMASNVAISSLMVTSRCSLNFGGVVGYNLSWSSDIYSFNSNQTFQISSFDSLTAKAIF